MLVFENEVHAILTLEQKYIKVSLGEIFLCLCSKHVKQMVKGFGKSR